MDNNGSRASTYGIGLFSIALLSRWITGNILFTGTEGLLRFGVIGILTFSLAGFLAFNTMIPLAGRLARQSNSFSLLEILEDRLSPDAFYWMKRLLLLGLYFNLCMIGYAVGILLYSLSIPVYIGMSVFFFVGFSLAIFLKLRWFAKYSMLKVGILFLLIIMLLVYSYLFEGIQIVYDGIRLYHPYLLFISWRNFPLLLFAFWCVLFGNLLTDLKTWAVILSYKGTKRGLGLTVTGFLWGTIPFSLAMIALSAIYIRGFESVLAVFQRIFTRYDHLTVTLLLVIVVLLILMETFLSNLQTLFIFYDKKEQKLNRRMWLIGIVFVIVIPLVIKLFSFSILDLFFLFGSFFAACAPILGNLFWQREKQGMFPILTIAVTTITGWVLYFLGIYQYSVLGSFSLALSAVVLQWLFPFPGRKFST
jgi:hypothetical protein